MSRVTYFPRYSTAENVVTNTTLHLFSQIYQHSTETLQSTLSELLGDADLALGVDFHQQTRKTKSVPDGTILQERVHIVIETKVDAGNNIDQLIAHCDGFEKGKTGNYLVLLTKTQVDRKTLAPVIKRASETGATFHNVTFEKLCESLKDVAKEHETHLLRMVEDYLEYCVDMNLLPDRRKWLRIVPCGATFDLNEKWNVYYHATNRGYSPHEYLGIYYNKAVRLIGRIAAIYDNKADPKGVMELTIVEGTGSDRPEFRERIKLMVAASKAKLGWDVSGDMRFFCVEKFEPTEFKKTSSGGIQGPRFLDVSEQAKSHSDLELAQLLRNQTWE